MDLRSLVILIVVCIQCTQGMFVPSSSSRDFFRLKKTAPTADSKYSDLLRDLAVIKLKLETMSYGPVYIEGPYGPGPMAKSLKDTDSPNSSPTVIAPPAAAEELPSQFNEMALLELIPVIIEQKRLGNVSPEEETTLKEIFGDLWIVIEEEVSRTKDEEMNPILKALLQSNNDGRLKRALVQHTHQHQRRQHQAAAERQYFDDGTGLEVDETNDIIGNSVDLVRVTRWPKSFVEVNPEQLSPQQRLMRHAAFQIRQWFDMNSPQRSTRGGLRRHRNSNNNNSKLNKRRRNKKRGRAANKNRRKNANRQVGEGRLRKRQQKQQQFENIRPKRHNTEIYVDDNHGYFEYEDFDDDSFDDMMTKPRSMRSSGRQYYEEYDSTEEDDAVLAEESED